MARAYRFETTGKSAEKKTDDRTADGLSMVRKVAEGEKRLVKPDEDRE
ncbi:hypothetical protein [Rhizobium rhizosphaerae]|nr:hypothetical protein [Xaviernesmea rhizosphaerae]